MLRRTYIRSQFNITLNDTVKELTTRLQFNPLAARCRKENFCQFQRQHSIPAARGLDFQCQNTRLFTKPLFFWKHVCQEPCFEDNGFTKKAVLPLWHLERKKKKSLNGKKDQVAALHIPCLLPTDCATVLEARFHNYTVLAHNYLQLG